MSRHEIACVACGARNEIVAFACAACGEPLVAENDARFLDAQQSAARTAERARATAVRNARLRRLALVVLATLVVGSVVWVTYDWASRNVYTSGEPTYAGETAAQWLVTLRSDDHFMRRRAALALATMAESFNERTAREVVGPLAEALDDEDEVVATRVAEALATIQERTGVSAREASP